MCIARVRSRLNGCIRCLSLARMPEPAVWAVSSDVLANRVHRSAKVTRFSEHWHGFERIASWASWHVFFHAQDEPGVV